MEDQTTPATPTTPALAITPNLTVGMSNFGKQNTPPLIQKIGDVALLAGAIGVSIVGLPATLAAAGVAGFVLPAVLAVAGKGLITAGVFGKLLSKFFGGAGKVGE